MTTTRTLSQLLQTPTQVIADLESGDVLLTRRGDESLRLSKASRADAEEKAVSAMAQLIAASLDEQAAERMLVHLAEPFPWVELFPAPRRREFLGSFLRLTRACASVGNFERLSIFLEAWEATAAAYADPGLTPDGSDLTYLSDVEAVPDPRATA